MIEYKYEVILGASVLLLCLIVNWEIFINWFFKCVNAILNHKLKTLIFWMLIAWSIGIYGYLEAFPNDPKMPFVWLESTYMSWCSAALWSIVNMMYQTSGDLNNGYIVFSKIMTIIGMVIIIALTLLKSMLENLRLATLNQIPHSLVIGLGENNRYYLDSEKAQGNEEKIIIIEKDVKNDYINAYKNKGFAVFVGTIENYEINFSTLKSVVISSGDDTTNLEIAGDIINKIPDNCNVTTSDASTVIHIHLINQDMRGLLSRGLFDKKSHHIEFRSYSFDDDAARKLFEDHTVLGNFQELAQRSTGYHIAVVGDGNLAERVIYHLCMQTALPNRNHCTIHCITPDADRFIARLRSKFMGIGQKGQIDWLTLQAHSVEYGSLDFISCCYGWDMHFLTNVIVCDDDERKNLEIITNLHEKVFLKKAVCKTLRTKIHFALYHNTELGLSITNNNKNEYEQFFAFGNAKSICDRDHFVNERYENIAKLIHKGYGEEYTPEIWSDLNDEGVTKKISEKWRDSTNFSDRESNRSQALHINSKLLSMGLKKELRETNPGKEKCDELLKKNKIAMEKHFSAFFEKIMDEKSFIHASCQLELDYKQSAYDKSPLEKLFKNVVKGNSLISKLALAEHERWNAFHYLNGWRYDIKKKKDIKIHNCLIPLKDFSHYDIQKTILFDLYSIMYLPNYLASTGYEIVPIDTFTIGITGHRNIDINDQKLKSVLTEELSGIFTIYDKVTLLSPLAEGSDRLFVHTALDIGAEKIQKLRVMMPFEEEVYLKDFVTVESKEEFKKMTPDECSKKYRDVDVELLTVSCRENKDDGYLKAGQWTARNSDILIAIWDGKPANGQGGTAEIVEYAKKEKKKIIWINPITYKVECIINSDTPCRTTV